MAAALAAPLLSACGMGAGCRIRDVEYNGWRCVELANERVAVVVAPEIGGRIIQLRLDGFEYLWVNRELAGKVRRYPEAEGPAAGAAAKVEWANYGGDKLWPAPQGWSSSEEWPGPPDPVDRGGRTDHGSFRLEVISRGPSEVVVRLKGPDDLYAGIRFEREVRLRAGSTTVDLKSRMVNSSRRPVRWGIWQVTQHGALAREGFPASAPGAGAPAASGLSAWAPIHLGSRFPWGYKVMFGPEDNPQFKVEPSPAMGSKLFHLEYSHQVGKAGLDCAGGWLAVTHDASGHLFCHTFPPEADREHPDGASVEFWASGMGSIRLGGREEELGPGEPWLVESEVLSPYVRLEPGGKYEFATRVHLARGRGPVLGVTGAAAVLKPLRRGERGGLSGVVAVFEDGTVHLRGLSPGGPPAVRLGEVRAGDSIDLADPSFAATIEASGAGAIEGGAALELASPAGVVLERLPIGENAR